MLPLGDRRLALAELVAAKGGLVAADLVDRLTDGRAVVRANALLGLAALGHTGSELVPFLRDGEAEVARAAAEALAHLGASQRPHLVAIATALDGARREVTDIVETLFAELIGQADAELTGVLDTREAAAVTAIVGACARRGLQGLYLLVAAARDPRARVRINALGGVALLAELDAGSSLEVLRAVAADDQAADVRAAAQRAVATMTQRLADAVTARRKAGGPTAAAVPELELRALTPAGLETPDEAHGLRIVELICLLPDARELLFIAFDGEAQNVQINAALGIGALGAKRAGPEGRRRLSARLVGPPTRRRDAVVKALAMLGATSPVG